MDALRTEQLVDLDKVKHRLTRRKVVIKMDRRPRIMYKQYTLYLCYTF